MTTTAPTSPRPVADESPASASAHDGAGSSCSPLGRIVSSLSLSLIFQYLTPSELLAVSQVAPLWYAAACSPLTFRGSVRIETDGRVGLRVRGPQCTFHRASAMSAASQSNLFVNFRVLTLSTVETAQAEAMVAHLSHFRSVVSLTIDLRQASGLVSLLQAASESAALKHLQVVQVHSLSMWPLAYVPTTITHIGILGAMAWAEIEPEHLATLRRFPNLKCFSAAGFGLQALAQLAQALADVATANSEFQLLTSFQPTVKAISQFQKRSAQAMPAPLATPLAAAADDEEGDAVSAQQSASSSSASIRFVRQLSVADLPLGGSGMTLKALTMPLPRILATFPDLRELVILRGSLDRFIPISLIDAISLADDMVWGAESTVTPILKLRLEARGDDESRLPDRWMLLRLRHSGPTFRHLTHLDWSCEYTDDGFWTTCFTQWSNLVHLHLPVYLTDCQAFGHLPQLKTLLGVGWAQVSDRGATEPAQDLAIQCQKRGAFFPSLQVLEVRHIVTAKLNPGLQRNPSLTRAFTGEDLAFFVDAIPTLTQLTVVPNGTIGTMLHLGNLREFVTAQKAEFARPFDLSALRLHTVAPTSTLLPVLSADSLLSGLGMSSYAPTSAAAASPATNPFNHVATVATVEGSPFANVSAAFSGSGPAAPGGFSSLASKQRRRATKKAEVAPRASKLYPDICD